MIEIVRSYVIEAAHRLPGVPNTHKCFGMHGHTWRIRIAVTGPIDPVTGMIIDYYDLDTLWMRHVHAKLDHRVLNETIPNPTTEHIAPWIYAALVEQLASRGIRLLEVKVGEGPDAGAVFRAEPPIQ